MYEYQESGRLFYGFHIHVYVYEIYTYTNVVEFVEATQTKMASFRCEKRLI